MAVIVQPIHEWHCPACGKTSQTRAVQTHTQFHPCPKLRGVDVPMLPIGTKAKLELVEWQDYVGRERVQVDPERRRPIQSLVTTRDHGQDVAVYAPTATLEGST